jgi:hypothetical protein
MRVATRVGLLIPVLILAFPRWTFAEEPVVRVDQWLAGPGNGVVFSEGRGSPEVAPDVEFDYTTHNGLYDVAIDLKTIRWAGDCACFRYYIFYVRAHDTQAVTRHKLRAEPLGMFPDQVVTVKLIVEQGTRTDTADVPLPVAAGPGNQPAEGLTLGIDDGMLRVPLWGPKQVSLRLHKTWAIVPLSVAVEVTPEANEYWNKKPQVATPTVDMRQITQADLDVALEPTFGSAVQASLLSTSLDKAHTALRAKVTYRNEYFQDRPLSFEQSIPVRFWPSLGWLALSLVVGVALGSLLRLLTPAAARVRWSVWFKATLAAALAALILWCIGALLVSFDSKFVVVGYDLDPRQILPTLLLGAICGLLGFEAAKLLKILP